MNLTVLSEESKISYSEGEFGMKLLVSVTVMASFIAMKLKPERITLPVSKASGRSIESRRVIALNLSTEASSLIEPLSDKTIRAFCCSLQ